jgi:dTMP kinase
VDEVIRPSLLRGEVVLTDRYLLANVVYQGHAGGLDPDDLWRLGWFGTGGLMPDRTLVFDLPVDVARARGKREADRLESRGVVYMQRVRTGYLAEVRRRPDQYTLIDAGPDEDTVAKEVWAAVEPLVKRRGR